MSNIEKSICTIDTNGDKRWLLNDKLHRENGPASKKKRLQ